MINWSSSTPGSALAPCGDALVVCCIVVVGSLKVCFPGLDADFSIFLLGFYRVHGQGRRHTSMKCRFFSPDLVKDCHQGAKVPRYYSKLIFEKHLSSHVP